MEQQSNMRTILEDKQKKISASGNLLTRLWRTILYEEGITVKIYDNMMRRYLHNPNSGIEDNATARNNHRGNLTKELSSNHMTFRSLMKGLRVLEVEEFEFGVILKRRGVPTLLRHSVTGKQIVQFDEHLGTFAESAIVDDFDAQINRAREIAKSIPEPKVITDPSKLLQGFKLPEGAKPKEEE